MKNIRNLILTTMLAILLISCVAIEPTRHTAPAPTIDYDELSNLLDESLLTMLKKNKISIDFEGVQITDLVPAIEKIAFLEKGEFESTSDYNQRKQESFKQKILDNYHIDDVFVFVVPVLTKRKFDSGFKYSYNADTSNVGLYVLPSSSIYDTLNGIGAPDNHTPEISDGFDQFILDSTVVSTSTYQGSNAYGVTATVTKTRFASFGIAANKIPFLNINRLSSSDKRISSQFTMESTKASQELPALKAMIFVKPNDPYLVYNFSYIGPELGSPNEFNTQEKFLTGDVIGVIFYSGITGEIFSRLPDDFGKPN